VLTTVLHQQRKQLREPARNVGYGSAVGHHGELVQGTFHDRLGVPRPGLITMPLPGLVTRAEFRPSPVARPDSLVTVVPAWKQKAQRAAELLLRRHVPTATGGELVISGQTPPGLGLGSSTSDVTAALRAVADCYGIRLADTELAALAVQAEHASDSVMLEHRVVLFASRSGQILEEFPQPLPDMVVVGCDTDPDRGGVDTLAMPPAVATPADLARFRVLLGYFRHALATRSVPLLARVAEASAVLNQRILPTREFAHLRRTARETGGLGVQIAHSGTVAGIIFDPHQRDTARRVAECSRALRRHGFTEPHVFEVPGT
jgi:uncharacterized protein involved in propanediol utilization